MKKAILSTNIGMTQIFNADGVLAVSYTHLLTARIVIIMKMIYRDKIMGEGLNATTTNLAEIREYGRNTNLITSCLLYTSRCV